MPCCCVDICAQWLIPNVANESTETAKQTRYSARFWTNRPCICVEIKSQTNIQLNLLHWPLFLVCMAAISGAGDILVPMIQTPGLRRPPWWLCSAATSGQLSITAGGGVCISIVKMKWFFCVYDSELSLDLFKLFCRSDWKKKCIG